MRWRFAGTLVRVVLFSALLFKCRWVRVSYVLRNRLRVQSFPFRVRESGHVT
jgi:hypothetical protein